jgi:hypothetical protein
MSILKNTTINDNQYLKLPVGTTIERPSQVSGYIRYNSTLKTIEYNDGNVWRYIPDIVRGGLILHLDIGEPSSYPGSGTTWFDLSGLGTNGTLVNGVGYNGSNGGSLVFDGVDDFVNSNSQLDPSAHGLFADSTSFWSVSAWFLPDTTNTSSGAIVGKSGGTGGSATFVVWEDGTILRTRLRGGTILDITTSLTSSWNEVVITWNGTTARAYLNGSFISNIAIGTAAKQTNNFCIGAALDGTNSFYKGNVSNVKVYNRPLNSQEVYYNFNAIKGRYLL